MNVKRKAKKKNRTKSCNEQKIKRIDWDPARGKARPSQPGTKIVYVRIISISIQKVNVLIRVSNITALKHHESHVYTHTGYTDSYFSCIPQIRNSVIPPSYQLASLWQLGKTIGSHYDVDPYHFTTRSFTTSA